MTVVDLETLRQRAIDGDGDAQMALARVFDREGRHDIALQWLQRAADGGHLPSLTALGARLLTGRGAPHMPGQGAQMIAVAANEGHAGACALMAVFHASGQTQPQSWSRALEYLFRAAEGGDIRALQQIALLVSDSFLGQRLLEAQGAPPWAEARAGIDLAQWMQVRPPRPLSDAPRVMVFENFIPVRLCQWIIELARPKLEGARILDEAGGRRADSYRTNTGTGFSLVETDLILQLVHRRIAAATQITADCQEPTNVLHYAVGQQYGPHFDFLDPEAPQFAARLAREGQRVGTFLVYLNDDFEGGETHFPDLGLRYRGQPGDGLFFWNVDPAGAVDRRTLHAGLAPTRGEKWLLSKWIRDRPQPQY